MGNTVLDKVLGFDFGQMGSLVILLKIPLIIILAVCMFYSFMLILKIRILHDTIDLEESDKAKVLVYANLVVSLVIGVLGIIIIVLG
ncbi:MAG TPA: hypothetical protein PLK49_01245 [Candidatus Dojkabacteria bacterium]|jgi:hypothetical protein|nr:hypothetical protein [Candidatus Dojkabacteria bacterium]HPM14013.1 hypothetical protein [Candidatus Dojkabacteria bacterium]